MGRQNCTTQEIIVKIFKNGMQNQHYLPHTKLPNTCHKTKALKN